MNSAELRRNMASAAHDYLSSIKVGESNLLLDATGPRVTIHLPYLLSFFANGEMPKFNRVYACSGGIAAYCIYLAHINEGFRRSFFNDSNLEDSGIFNSNSKSFFTVFKGLYRYSQKKPYFDSLPFMDFFRNIMKADFLRTPFKTIAPEFVPIMSTPGARQPVEVTEENGFDLNKMTFEDIMSAGLRVPWLYQGDEKSSWAYDAFYTDSYWLYRRTLSRSVSSLIVLTQQTNGIHRKCCAINIFKDTTKLSEYRDYISLLLNRPNARHYSDLKLAFG